ncbi:MAG: cobalamin biosynthesis protein [Pseudotabrizicola sp.]|uniref:cobalamin biosynthesis protein n=1 Tax=Pseudotabrizicola sp. TaxID=2939647 RepID=UPI0027283B60|nr:cobalamin biosynthesis protein [Pseudotabrizicola sp.]MDO9638432.1 cobalamin biosynthesis protein [Pseudotabrizicola sp.]
MKVAGFGFRGAATPDALQDALIAAGGAAGLTALATAADKATAPVFAALSRTLNLPVLAVGLPALRATPATPSGHAPARYGRHSLAEAAALAAAGPGARLTGPRAVSACGTATCAIAERSTP